MSAIEELRSYLKRLQRRLRLGAVARGSAILAVAALLATIILTVIINRFAFSPASLWSARAALLLTLALGAALGMAIPLWRLTRRWWARAERTFPQFEQRLLTFAERGRDSRDPFLELLAADTLRVAHTADVKAVAPDTALIALFAISAASLGALIWLVHAGPGYLGYGAAALWTGPGPAPFYDVHVSPGDATVRRHSDQLVTALLVGLQTDRLRIHVRYQSASKWEEAAMQPQPAAAGFQFLFAGIPEDIEYYVEAGSMQSPHFHLHVADVPAVKQVRVTYHHPAWMNLADTVEAHGGDLRAIEGTEAQLEIQTDGPLSGGVLAVDDGRQIALTHGTGNVYRGAIKMAKNGSYHVAARARAQVLRISEDYFIEASEVKRPDVALVRPARDYPASPIEEVTVGATAGDAFGLSEFTLHYSVNGGRERSVNLMKQAGTTKASGAAMLSLEALQLVPGDVISVYADAKDAHSESRTDIAFIQIEPFEREYSQSQAGGGGGGGAADNQAQIAQREKEIIGATWKQAGLTNAAAKQSAEQAKFLSDVQSTLRSQALSLAGRLQMRDLQLANEQFGSFQQDMEAAATAMRPAAQSLQQQQWRVAVADEQKALQHLLRAEATFRQIEVAIGSRGGGSGAVNSAGRDLASLFDLELDTQKNQYESAQAPSSENQRAAQIDDALRKLDELARQQNDLAAQPGSGTDRAAEQRWQQEMLRRKADELQQQLQQLARNGGQPQGGAAAGESGSQQARGTARGQNAADAAAQQALTQLRQAEEDMRRSVDQHDTAAAHRAAERLREAMNLLGGVQQQSASRQLDSLGRQAGRLASVQREQAERLRGMLAGHDSSHASDMPRAGGGTGLAAFIDDRQRLADDLGRLAQDLRTAERETLERSHAAAAKLRDALGDLDQSDTETQLQRSADMLRRGYAPVSDAAETEIASALQHLQEQLGEAQQAMSKGEPSSSGALDAVERLRSRLAALDQNRRVGGPVGGGGRGGAVDGGWNAGNNSELPRPVGPDTSAPPADTRRVYEEGMNELGKLRRAVGDDSQSRRQVDDLVRSMRKLDPRRFPGNPAMVDALYARVLSGVDRLELQLRHEPDEGEAAEVRSGNPLPVPASYQAAVAEYFRRLSKSP